MTISEWLKGAKEKIPSLDAELILCSALNFDDRVDIVLYADQEFDFKTADEMVKKRESGVPLAYIVGFKEFYGRNFKVDKNVLIPRPETEQIIISALSIIDVEKFKNVRILDVGTGSGCIPITLKLELNSEGINSEIFGIDVSEPALKIAEENAKSLDVDVTFFNSNLLEKVDSLPDILIANLPYVDMNWDWKSEELKFEPALALFAEDGGLKLIKKLIDEIAEKDSTYSKTSELKSPKFLILEADTSQHDEIIKYAKSKGLNLINHSNFAISFKF
ncbi:peptide chain release factor N(5)-glutamine methyltransferase [Candidatus Saccharibacteria bacterium]|nr:peptide chain release factor N(5)-glutamine methyltransferase [Candidatus Saccharibacteria bacterium]